MFLAGDGGMKCDAETRGMLPNYRYLCPTSSPRHSLRAPENTGGMT